MTLAVGLLLAALPAHASSQTNVVRVLAGSGTRDIYGFGLGGAAGFERPLIGGKPFFLGVRALYHFGTKRELPSVINPGATAIEGSVRQFHLGIEIGSTWIQSPILLRTVGGAGVARIRGEVDTGDSEITAWQEKFQFGPGLLLAIPTDSGTFFGVEVRWVKVLDLPDTFAIYGTLGKKFF